MRNFYASIPALARLIVVTATLLAAGGRAGAADANYAFGVYGGFAPSLGGNLHTAQHQSEFQSSTGIDGMNRALDGTDAGRMDRLAGLSMGMQVKALFYEYYQVRLAGNYTMAITGGEGTTVYGSGTELDCEYSFWSYDIPLTFGLSIPFWKDIKIVFSCGAAFAYGRYEYDFESSAGTKWKGSFSGWAFPLVILLEGEYFLTNNIAVASSIAYYRGSSRVIEDGSDSGGTDFARVNFNGYRVNFGMTFYFFPI
jgi:hypothetical protein